MKAKEGGFSLIELMIVVAIIGILSSMAVPNMISGAKKALARSHLKQIVAALKPLRISEDRNKTLTEVVGHGCAVCDLIPLARQDVSSLATNAAYTGHWQRLGFDQPPRDPWGHLYLLDQNDEEFVDCRMDALYSAGPDGIWEGVGDGDDVGGDDLVARVPWINKQGCHEEGATGGTPN